MKIGGRLNRVAMAIFLVGVLPIVGFGMAETVHAEPIYQVKIIAQQSSQHSFWLDYCWLHGLLFAAASIAAILGLSQIQNAASNRSLHTW